MDDSRWCVCPNCGHKLFRYVEAKEMSWFEIETKCGGCKGIVTVSNGICASGEKVDFRPRKAVK